MTDKDPENAMDTQSVTDNPSVKEEINPRSNKGQENISSHPSVDNEDKADSDNKGSSTPECVADSSEGNQIASDLYEGVKDTKTNAGTSETESSTTSISLQADDHGVTQQVLLSSTQPVKDEETETDEKKTVAHGLTHIEEQEETNSMGYKHDSVSTEINSLSAEASQSEDNTSGTSAQSANIHSDPKKDSYNSKEPCQFDKHVDNKPAITEASQIVEPSQEDGNKEVVTPDQIDCSVDSSSKSSSPTAELLENMPAQSGSRSMISNSETGTPEKMENIVSEKTEASYSVEILNTALQPADLPESSSRPDCVDDSSEGNQIASDLYEGVKDTNNNAGTSETECSITSVPLQADDHGVTQQVLLSSTQPVKDEETEIDEKNTMAHGLTHIKEQEETNSMGSKLHDSMSTEITSPSAEASQSEDNTSSTSAQSVNIHSDPKKDDVTCQTKITMEHKDIQAPDRNVNKEDADKEPSQDNECHTTSSTSQTNQTSGHQITTRTMNEEDRVGVCTEDRSSETAGNEKNTDEKGTVSDFTEEHTELSNVTQNTSLNSMRTERPNSKKPCQFDKHVDNKPAITEASQTVEPSQEDENKEVVTPDQIDCSVDSSSKSSSPTAELLETMPAQSGSRSMISKSETGTPEKTEKIVSEKTEACYSDEIQKTALQPADLPESSSRPDCVDDSSEGNQIASDLYEGVKDTNNNAGTSETECSTTSIPLQADDHGVTQQVLLSSTQPVKDEETEIDEKNTMAHGLTHIKEQEETNSMGSKQHDSMSTEITSPSAEASQSEDNTSSTSAQSVNIHSDPKKDDVTCQTKITMEHKDIQAPDRNVNKEDADKEPSQDNECHTTSSTSQTNQTSGHQITTRTMNEEDRVGVCTEDRSSEIAGNEKYTDEKGTVSDFTEEHTELSNVTQNTSLNFMRTERPNSKEPCQFDKHVDNKPAITAASQTVEPSQEDGNKEVVTPDQTDCSVDSSSKSSSPTAELLETMPAQSGSRSMISKSETGTPEKIENNLSEKTEACFSDEIQNTALQPADLPEITEKSTALGHETEITHNEQQQAYRGKKKTELGMTTDGCEVQNIEELLIRLNLMQNHEKKMKTSDVLKLTSLSLNLQTPCAEKDLVQTFLQRLLMMDYRARYITTEEKVTDLHHTYINIEDEEGSFADFLTIKTVSPEREPHENLVHPMDVQMAMFHCSDHFLKQLIVTKLSQCQYALPLLVPDPFTREINSPLWTFRQINKSWKTMDTSGNTNSKTQPIYESETPMVAFFRFGSVSSSKSQLINNLINEKHSTFFDRDCPGSSRNRLLMDGVVEIAWYCPSGKESDHFGDRVAFCNLHGDADCNEEQLGLLTEMSSVNVVLLSDPTKVANNETLNNLFKGTKPLICLLSEDDLGVSSTKNGKYRIGLKDKNKSGVSRNLRASIKECITRSHSNFSLDHLSKNKMVRIDEDDSECKRGKEAALNMMSQMEGKEISKLKEKHLPCQGKLWHDWCEMNKDLHRLQGKNLEIKKSAKREEMKKVREKQHKYGLSGLMKQFISTLNSSAGNEKLYFLKWVGILLDEFTTDDLSDIHYKYNEKWKNVLDLKNKHEKSDKLKGAQNELEELAEKLNAANFGLEHILREMGQIYESFMSLQTQAKESVTENVSSFPKLAAELIISGFPMELMDGDAAHVPLVWVSAVLDELINELGDQRVFVLSVLGTQSSGKSTMLNAMFGLQFAVSAGRCTRGAFMQLVRVSEEMKAELQFDYILIVDTEGLCALELAGKSTRHHDNELATFVVGLGNMTLINIIGESSAEMQDVLQIVVQAFLRMKEVRLKPSCMIVHQNVDEITAEKHLLDQRRCLEEKLDEITKLTADAEENEAECFNDIIGFNLQDDLQYFAHLWEGSPPMAPINPSYSENILTLKQTIFQKASMSHSVTLSQLKTRICDLWKALLNESFVFSFKNTLEIALYRKLETEFKKWTWTLRRAMLDTEEKLHNRIENRQVEEIKEKDLYDDMKKTKQEVEQSMKRYFEENKEKVVLTKFQLRYANKINQILENLVKDATRSLNEAIQQQNIRDTFELKKAENNQHFFNLIKELALNLKCKAMNEQVLQQEFDNFWDKLITDLTSDTMSKLISFPREVVQNLLELHKQFRDSNEQRWYLENQKPQYYSVFLNYYKGASTFEDFLCSNLTPSILQAAYNKSAIDLSAQIRSDMPEFNGNRSGLEKHILKTLAEEENFEKYITYIHNPKDHFKQFIKELVNKYITENGTKVLDLFKGNLKYKEQRVINALNIATEEVKNRGGDAGMWLKSFSSSLKDELSLKEITWVDLEKITDLDFLQQVVHDGLTKIMSDQYKSFNSVKDIAMEKFRRKPDEILIEHLYQCCWVQCPFCKAICTNTIEDHDGDHSVPFHRINGINGCHYRGTTEFCTDFCTTAVQSDTDFQPNQHTDESVPFKNYETAGGKYEKWSITPDISELPYWKWFVVRFEKDLEKHYNKKFHGDGEIPNDWRKFTKKQALDSLDEYI